MDAPVIGICHTITGESNSHRGFMTYAANRGWRVYKADVKRHSYKERIRGHEKHLASVQLSGQTRLKAKKGSSGLKEDTSRRKEEENSRSGVHFTWCTPIYFFYPSDLLYVKGVEEIEG